MTKLFITGTIILAIFFGSIGLTTPSVPQVHGDTIKPRYEYYYKLMIPVNKFSPPLDTINMVLDKLGKSLSVDQADELRAIVVRQLNNFIGRPVVDSVKIGGATK